MHAGACGMTEWRSPPTKIRQGWVGKGCCSISSTSWEPEPPNPNSWLGHTRRNPHQDKNPNFNSLPWKPGVCFILKLKVKKWAHACAWAKGVCCFRQWGSENCIVSVLFKYSSRCLTSTLAFNCWDSAWCRARWSLHSCTHKRLLGEHAFPAYIVGVSYFSYFHSQSKPKAHVRVA